MAFYIGRPLPAFEMPPLPPPPPPPPQPYPHPSAPQFGGYYQPPELITRLYHKLSIIDYELRCPIDLVHLMVKAAMRDPVIAQDIDLLVARRSEEFRPHPQSSHQPPPNQAPMMGNFPPPTHQQQPQPGPAPQGTPRPQQIPAPTRHQGPASTSASSSAPTPTPGPGLGPGLGPAQVGPSENRERSQSTATPSDGTASSRQREVTPEITVGGVPLHLIKSPKVIPRCPRPAKSASELQVPQKASASNAGGRSARRGEVIDLTNDEGDPEPREKPADYSKLLEQTEKDLGWHGKYDNVSDRRQVTLGIEVSFKIGKLLERLRGYMDNHQSFPNRLHILTVMREILMAVLQTEGSRIGHEVRQSAFEYDANFVWAVEKLTGDQRRKLKAQNDGKWVEGLEELIELANAYCSFPELRKALAMIDPDAAEADSEDAE